MVYRKQIGITPSTITNLTVVVKDITFFTTLTLDDFTLDGDVLTGRLTVGDSDAPISIYSQGYEPIMTTFRDISETITLNPTSDYIKTSDGTNDYYVKDKYSRQFGNDLLDIVMTKADSSDIPAAVTESTVSGWGFTKNTGTVTSVNNVNPVNGNVTLRITSSDVTTALGYTPPSSEAVSDLFNNRAARDLENITSMGTVISGEFDNVYTALDSKANTDLSNLSTTGQNKFDAKLNNDYSNIELIGSPTLNNHVISGFSTSSYGRIENPTNIQINNFEQLLKVKINSLSATQAIASGDPYEGLGTIQIIGTGAFKAYISSNGTANDISNGTESSVCITTNTDYWIKYAWNGSNYTIDVSTNGIDYTNELSISSSLAPNFKGFVGIGIDSGTTPVSTPCLGSVDLNASYIKINGSYWWKGVANADNFDNLIPTLGLDNKVSKSDVWYDSTSSTLYIGVAQ